MMAEGLSLSLLLMQLLQLLLPFLSYPCGSDKENILARLHIGILE